MTNEYKNLEELKVLTVGISGVISSYIGYKLTGLDWLRILVLTATLLYTIRRWYLMEKRNKHFKNNNKNKEDEKND